MKRCIFVFMIDHQQEQFIRQDFEKYSKHLKNQGISYDLERFVSFSSSLINFYIGGSLLSLEQKNDAALYICHLFNGGLQQKISTDDLKQIVDIIVEDNTLDYQIIHSIFN